MKLTILLFAALSALAQSMPPSGGRVSATIGPRGDSLPSTCSIGQLFQRSGSTNPGLYSCGAVNTWTLIGGATATGDVTGAASSVDGEVALFSGTGGKTIKRATGTGLALLTSGVLSADSGLQFNTSTKSLGVFGPIVSGQTSTYLGKILLNGITSGTVTIQPADAAGTWSFTLPANDGEANQVLKTDGNGVTSWATPSGGSAAYSQSFTSQTSVALTHALGTTDVIVQCYNGASPPNAVEPNSIALTDANTVTVTFTSSQSGKCVVR
jgi:hypothetical protein